MRPRKLSKVKQPVTVALGFSLAHILRFLSPFQYFPQLKWEDDCTRTTRELVKYATSQASP